MPASAPRAPEAPWDAGRKTVTRPFIHPGEVTPPRFAEMSTGEVEEELRISVPPGANVGRALHRVLDHHGSQERCGRIVGGFCDHVRYHVIVPALAGTKPYVYGAPIDVTGLTALISAAITIGHKDDSDRISTVTAAS
jgi:hypothetical protein